MIEETWTNILTSGWKGLKLVKIEQFHIKNDTMYERLDFRCFGCFLGQKSEL